ncbi:hypothetical protein AVEN_49681-1 [Araneus ventricosus]|uniref:Uncharacterized protein n=1 Tax=Araneus ventricosus TaxID=182803 RepID=A0A4Y2SY26_ARAVE|nr:hypothetical protein AVEN_49681-1 [Araneus ventricosus]
MEELLESLLAKRELTHQFIRENRRFSERCCDVVLLRDRMRRWCQELLDDLTLIDFEDVDHSTYGISVRYMTTLINKCWRDIEVTLTIAYKDVGWLHQKLNVFEADTVKVWWFMAEDINKRQQRIDDFISRFYKLHVLFEEMVEVYLELFREKTLSIFEKYKHY